MFRYCKRTFERGKAAIAVVLVVLLVTRAIVETRIAVALAGASDTDSV